jgi:DNA-binding NarL/FixJ family response regulator
MPTTSTAFPPAPLLRMVPPTPLPTVLCTRELMALRLLADGCDTREIARHLCYSERTVKSIIGTVTDRLGVRNRTQAVAHAIRHGLI